MANRRVLIITDSFPPAGGGAVQRIVGFCKYLMVNGWNPLILTLRDDLYRTYDYSMNEKIKGIEVFRTFSLDADSLKTILSCKLKFSDSKLPDPNSHLPTPNSLLNRFKSFIERYILIPDPKLGWLPFAILKGIKVIKDKRPDVIFAVYPYPTTLLIGYALKRLFNIPLILDMHDTWTLYPEWLIEKDGRLSNSLFLKIRKRLEEYMLKIIFNSSSVIITNTEYMKALYRAKYPSVPSSKYVTVNNGYDPDDFTGIDSPLETRFDKFTIAFSGRYYRYHHPLYFLKGLKRLIDKYPEFRDDLSVVFVGNFGRDNELELKKMGLEDVVSIIGYKPYKENLKIISRADVLLITLLPPSDFNGYRIPSKAPEYLYLKKPILAIIPEGELNNLIERVKAGIAVNPEDTEGIGLAIYELYKKYKNNSLKIESDEEMIKGFDYRILSKKLAEALNSVVGDKP